ncbi:MAG: DUF3368 domain-containing protein [Holophagales bacterium]|nr:DUF3368 domain-containing protein [Holophagales bacterium]MYG29360.1 DUF3368 domain-containing protein [Holophagales bacterium]MYI80122.1 DUF3368 domain-containing protein [Holophagales bacterium]
MSQEVVADTGPLIALAHVGKLDLLRRLYGRVTVPKSVVSELAIGSSRPGVGALEAALCAGWLSCQEVSDSGLLKELRRLLGPGEAEAIALALEERARFLLIDDARGRRLARDRGVSVVGVAGVLLAAKARDELSTVGSTLQDLSNAGYRLSPRLIADVLAAAGEE